MCVLLFFCSGKPAELYEVSHPDWMPSQHMGYICKTGDVGRFQRCQEREKRQPKDLGNADPEDADMSPPDETQSLHELKHFLHINITTQSNIS